MIHLFPFKPGAGRVSKELAVEMQGHQREGKGVFIEVLMETDGLIGKNFFKKISKFKIILSIKIQ